MDDNFKKIVSCLKEKKAIDAESAIRTQDISEFICGKRQRKYANPYLYKLKDQKQVEMLLDDMQKKPRWYLLPAAKEGKWY